MRSVRFRLELRHVRFSLRVDVVLNAIGLVPTRTHHMLFRIRFDVLNAIGQIPTRTPPYAFPTRTPPYFSL